MRSDANCALCTLGAETALEIGRHLDTYRALRLTATNAAVIRISRPAAEKAVSLLQHPSDFFIGAPLTYKFSGRLQTYRVGGLIMTIAILNLNQRTAATSEAFAADDIRTLIARHLGIDVKRVSDEARFTHDLGADWFDRLELLILIEDHFDVEVPDEKNDQIEAVSDLIRHIENVNNDRQRRGADPVIRKLFGPSLPRAVKPQEGREQAAFFLRLANDAMRPLTCRCPTTQQQVDLQIYVDYVTLTRIRCSSVHFHCPHCNARHEAKVGIGSR
jgi:acyl carrier protein